MLHGDAAFAGQGITAEALNLADLPGYSVGGTIHVVVNNQIGFTTPTARQHSSPFSTDVAHRLPIPIFHVNGEDLPAVVHVARLAAEFRYAFESDVVVDLVGYRRHGHSEVDDPTITQPLMYKAIASHPPLWKVFAARAGLDAGDLPARIRAEFGQAQEDAKQLGARVALAQLPGYWSGYVGGCHDASYEVDTGVPLEDLRTIAGGPDDVAGRLLRPPQGREAARAAGGDGRRARAAWTTGWPRRWPSAACSGTASRCG